MKIIFSANQAQLRRSIFAEMISSPAQFQRPFFIGIAGAGMSALAQYLQSLGKNVSGSDRYFREGETHETQRKLEAEGIRCFLQDGSGITDATDLVVISTAIEETVAELQKAKQRNIPVIRRSELLAMIAASKKTIAVGGTSGKSTTAAMLFHILEAAGYHPGIISGAGLTSFIKKGKIGNAKAGTGEWLVIEADESDGSIVHYKPQLGILLNIDKDHQELDALMKIFSSFKNNSKQFVVNRAHPLARQFSQSIQQDFSADKNIPAAFMASGFRQTGFQIQFNVNDIPFTIQAAGTHNMENALAATAVAAQLGVPLNTCAEALSTFEGIYRRHQVYGMKNGVWLVDDYAHNPAKCAASIRACQPVAGKVIAWFQPHGYAPTRFLRHEFVEEISAALRPQDEIWMSEIFYAGGTTNKDISAKDLVEDLRLKNANAFFVDDRKELLHAVRSHFTNDCVFLLMGARDPSLEQFAASIWKHL